MSNVSHLPELPYIVDVKEAARLLSMSTAQIHMLIKKGDLPACRSSLTPPPAEGERDNRKKLIARKDVQAYAEFIRNGNAA